jgi:hypothetical protein
MFVFDAITRCILTFSRSSAMLDQRFCDGIPLRRHTSMAAIRIKRKQPVQPEPEEEQYGEIVEEEVVEEIVEEEPAEQYEEEVVEEVVEEEPEEEEPEVDDEPEEIAPVKRSAAAPKARPKSNLKSRIGKLSTEGKSSGGSGKGLSAGDKQTIIREYKVAAEKYKSARSQRNKLRPKFVRLVRTLAFLLRWTVKLCALAALLLCIYLVLQRPIRKAAKSDSKGVPAGFARVLHGGITNKVLGTSEEVRSGYLGWLIWAEDEAVPGTTQDEQVEAADGGVEDEAPVVADEGMSEKITALEAEIATLKASQGDNTAKLISGTLESVKEYTRQNQELVKRLETLTKDLQTLAGEPEKTESAVIAAPNVKPVVQKAPVAKPAAVKGGSNIDQTRRLLGR